MEKDKINWIIYIDESFTMNAGEYTDVVIGGFAIREDKKEKAFKILKQLKNQIGKQYKEEVKGGSLKGIYKINLIEKLALIKHCKILYWYEDFKESKEMQLDLDSGKNFSLKYYKIVSLFANKYLFKNKDHNGVRLHIELDQKSDLTIEKLKENLKKYYELNNENSILDLNYHIGDVKYVDSTKSYGVQIADIICNSFYQYHTKESVRNGKFGQSFKEIKRDIIYQNKRHKKDVD